MTQLAAMFSAFFNEDGGSARRFLIGVPAMAILALNTKLGLGLDTTAQGLLAAIAIAMITGSNLKDAVTGAVALHAGGKVQAAALAAGIPGEDIVHPLNTTASAPTPPAIPPVT